jgi:hypothetical protein
MKLDLLDRFSKNTQNVIKIRPVGANLIHADRHDEASSRFSQFCESPKEFAIIDWGLPSANNKTLYEQKNEHHTTQKMAAVTTVESSAVTEAE